MKECRGCADVLSHDSFQKHKGYRDGFKPLCKNCIDKRNKIRREAGDGKKACVRCHEHLRYDLFDKNSYGSYGLDHKCKECRRAIRAMEPNRIKAMERTILWQKNNPEKKRLHAARTRIKTKYGMSEKDFLVAHTERNGCCDICKKQCPAGPSHVLGIKCGLEIDHCHETGSFRGMLCRSCNLGIGNLNDNPDRVAAALKYLRHSGIRLVVN